MIARIGVIVWLVSCGSTFLVWAHGLRAIYLNVSPWAALGLSVLTLVLFFGLALLLDSQRRGQWR